MQKPSFHDVQNKLRSANSKSWQKVFFSQIRKAPLYESFIENWETGKLGNYKQTI